MEQKKYAKYKVRKVPRHRRSRSLEGSFEDRGKWYRCWNCGQIINIEKENGDPEREGTYYLADIYPSQSPYAAEDEYNVYSTMDGPLILGVGMEVGPDGTTPKEIYVPMKHYVSAGCAFCGCTNIP